MLLLSVGVKKVPSFADDPPNSMVFAYVEVAGLDINLLTRLNIRKGHVAVALLDEFAMVKDFKEVHHVHLHRRIMRP